MLKKSLYLLLIGVLAGLVATGCVIKDDPCDGITCDGHGTCIEYMDEAMCECDAGFKTSDDLVHCVPAGYTISLTWGYTGAADCTGAQVASVNVSMLEGGTEIANATINCADGDAADISEVADGSYDIELRATSNSGEMTYYGEGSVTVSGQDTALNITMEPIGFVIFTWDMRGLTCTAAGVSRVRVMVNTQDGTSNLYTASPIPSCDEGGHSTETAAFLYLDTYNLVLEGVCDSDLSTGYSFDADMVISEKGENNYGLLSLDAVGGGCP
jgi:hypothetical protein